MERPEFGDLHHKPEFNKNEPSELFSYASKKYQWLRKSLTSTGIEAQVEDLVSELTLHAGEVFDQQTPELTVRSTDVSYTRSITQSDAGKYVIETAPLPFEGDDAMYGEHNFKGVYAGFHKGVNNDLRVFVQNTQTPFIVDGATINRYLSVSVENSDIQLTTHEAAVRSARLGESITEQLVGYDESIKVLVRSLLKTVNSYGETVAKRLHSSSFELIDIVKTINTVKDSETSQQFIYTLLEYISMKLGFDVPQDIEVDAYQVRIGDRGYTTHGPASFKGITLQLGLMGESANRVVGAFFFDNDRAIQIRAQYITNIRKTLQEN